MKSLFLSFLAALLLAPAITVAGDSLPLVPAEQIEGQIDVLEFLGVDNLSTPGDGDGYYDRCRQRNRYGECIDRDRDHDRDRYDRCRYRDRYGNCRDHDRGDRCRYRDSRGYCRDHDRDDRRTEYVCYADAACGNTFSGRSRSASVAQSEALDNCRYRSIYPRSCRSAGCHVVSSRW